MEEKILDQDQIGAILKRAAELQGAEEPGKLSGLTLSELMRVAEETGIDPGYVRIAAWDLVSSADRDSATFWGGPLSLQLERTVEGEFDEITWERMVTEIRGSFKEPGAISRRGRAFEWTTAAKSGTGLQAYIRAIPSHGGTRIELFWTEPYLGAPFFVLAGAACVILLPVIFGALAMLSWPGAATYALLVGVLLGIARWTLAREARKRRRTLYKLAGKLERIASQTREATEHENKDMSALANVGPTLILPEDEESPEHDAPVKPERLKTS